MEQTNIYTTCRKSLGVVQDTVNVELNLTGNLIGKVLCFNSSAKIDSISALQGEAIVSGTIYSNLVYLNENGELKNEKVSTPFNLRVNNENVNAMSHIVGKVEIIENNITLATESMIEASVTIEGAFEELAQNEIQTFNNTQENIKTKMEKCVLTQVRTSANASFNVNGEQNVKVNANEVFITSVSPILKSVTAGTGYFTIEGEVCVSYIAQSQDEDKPIKCFTDTLSFKEEIENESLTKDDLILAYINTAINEAVVDLVKEEEKTQIVLTLPMYVNYVALYSVEQEIVTDAFSVDCETTLEYGNLPCCKINSTKYVETRIDGNFTILDSEPRIAKIVCVVPSNLSLTKTYVNENSLVVEGIVNACVSYETDDDDVYLSSVQAEIPFSSVFKNIVEESDQVFVVGAVCGAQARAKKGKEIDLDLDLNFSLDTYQTNSESVLTNLVFGECSTKSEYALRVYIAPAGSTLWDLSKKLRTSEEQIVKQNPGVIFPLEESTSIVYFSGKSEN